MNNWREGRAFEAEEGEWGQCPRAWNVKGPKIKQLELKGSERWGGSLEQRWEELRARSCKTFGHGDVLEFHCK